MDKIVIEGIPGYDGEYEFDFGGMNNNDMRRIKRLTGLRAGEFEEALMKVDTDLFVGLAAVALEEHGKFVDDDLLWTAKPGMIRLVLAPEETENPPEETQEKPSDSLEQTDEPSASSGDDSTADSDHQANGQSHIGLLDSPKSAIYDRETSAT